MTVDVIFWSLAIVGFARLYVWAMPRPDAPSEHMEDGVPW